MVRLLGRVSLSLFLLFGALVFSGAVVYAQTGQGTLTGSITDSSGAVIPAVAVVVKNQNTGFTYNAVTNEEGIYRVPYLNAGMYEVSYEATGFRRLVRNDIPIRSTETLGLDVTMEIGNVVESVEVSAGAQLLETETSTTGHLVSGTELTTLPTPQMKIESMMWYVSGVTSQSGNGHTAGGRSRAFQMTTDGVSATNPGEGTVATARNVTTVEHNMEEIKVLTTALPAEYGHSGGGIMNISYKGGTNEFHGLAEERYVSKKMIHRAWSDPAVPTRHLRIPPDVREHQRSHHTEQDLLPGRLAASPREIGKQHECRRAQSRHVGRRLQLSSIVGAGRHDLRPGFVGAAAERSVFAHSIPEQSDSAEPLRSGGC